MKLVLRDLRIYFQWLSRLAISRGADCPSEISNRENRRSGWRSLAFNPNS